MTVRRSAPPQLLKVEERRRDAAVMRFIGGRRRIILGALLLQALFVAGLDSGLGVALAAGGVTNNYYQHCFDTRLIFSQATFSIIRSSVLLSLAMLLNMVLLAGGIERSFGQLLLGRGYQIRISPKGTLPFDTEATIPGIARIRAAIALDPAVGSVAPLAGSGLYGRR